MKIIGELATIANSYADENYTDIMIMEFVNEAIARINISLDIELPFFTDIDTDYSVSILKESWQRMLFIPYIVYSIKVNDGSQNESLLSLQKFNQALQELKRSRSFDIPKKYRLRWYETTKELYDVAEHKATDYTSISAYEVDPEVLPNLGEPGKGVYYEDSYIRVLLANNIIKYYRLQDNKQAAVFKVGTGWY